MEREEFRKILPKLGAVFVTIVCLVCTILPSSAYMWSPSESLVYSMPLDFVFNMNNEPPQGGNEEYDYVGYLLSPQIDVDIDSNQFVNVAVYTDSGPIASYVTLAAQSISNNRLRCLFGVVLDERQWVDEIYEGEQRFSLTASGGVVRLGDEVVNLQHNNPDSDGYFDYVMSFKYKKLGDPTIYTYEDSENSAPTVGLIPNSRYFGLSNGDLVYIFDYRIDVIYYGDPFSTGVVENMTIATQTITEDVKHANEQLFITENDRLIAENGGSSAPVIDNVWLLNSVASFFNFEIFPGFSLGGVMGILFAITVLIAVLKFVAGG